MVVFNKDLFSEWLVMDDLTMAHLGSYGLSGLDRRRTEFTKKETPAGRCACDNFDVALLGELRWLLKELERGEAPSTCGEWLVITARRRLWCIENHSQKRDQETE
jgi:hypothetical protein